MDKYDLDEYAPIGVGNPIGEDIRRGVGIIKKSSNLKINDNKIKKMEKDNKQITVTQW